MASMLKIHGLKEGTDKKTRAMFARRVEKKKNCNFTIELNEFVYIQMNFENGLIGQVKTKDICTRRNVVWCARRRLYKFGWSQSDKFPNKQPFKNAPKEK